MKLPKLQKTKVTKTKQKTVANGDDVDNGGDDRVGVGGDNVIRIWFGCNSVYSRVFFVRGSRGREEEREWGCFKFIGFAMGEKCLIILSLPCLMFPSFFPDQPDISIVDPIKILFSKKLVPW